MALAAALDDGSATKQLEKVNLDLLIAERSVANLQTALAQASQKATEAEADRAAAAERARQQKIKDMVAARASLVAEIEDSVLNLESELKQLYETDKEIGGLVGGPMTGWYSEVNRLLRLESVKDRLLHFAGPRLHLWLDVPNRGMNPAYTGRPFREIEQEAVEAAVFGKQPERRMPRLGMTKAEAAALPPNPVNSKFDPKLSAPAITTREPSSPLAKAVRTLRGFTDDPKAIAEAEEAAKARSAQ